MIFQAIAWAVCVDSSSGGPNIISEGHHQRSTASCAMACWASVPRERASSASYPWRWWKDSSLQTLTIARAYGP